MRGVIIALGILIICAAISYSFEDLTGFVLRGPEYTSIVITPDPVEIGTQITVYINPGDPAGAKKYFTVHRENGIRKGIKTWCSLAQGTCYSSDEECKDTSFKCHMIKSVNYGTNDLSPGTHYVRIFDYELGNYISQPFEVCAKGDTMCLSGLPPLF